MRPRVLLVAAFLLPAVASAPRSHSASSPSTLPPSSHHSSSSHPSPSSHSPSSSSHHSSASPSGPAASGSDISNPIVPGNPSTFPLQQQEPVLPLPQQEPVSHHEPLGIPIKPKTHWSKIWTPAIEASVQKQAMQPVAINITANPGHFPNPARDGAIVTAGNSRTLDSRMVVAPVEAPPPAAPSVGSTITMAQIQNAATVQSPLANTAHPPTFLFRRQDSSLSSSMFSDPTTNMDSSNSMFSPSPSVDNSALSSLSSGSSMFSDPTTNMDASMFSSPSVGSMMTDPTALSDPFSSPGNSMFAPSPSASLSSSSLWSDPSTNMDQLMSGSGFNSIPSSSTSWSDPSSSGMFGNSNGWSGFSPPSTFNQWSDPASGSMFGSGNGWSGGSNNFYDPNNNPQWNPFNNGVGYDGINNGVSNVGFGDGANPFASGPNPNAAEMGNPAFGGPYIGPGFQNNGLLGPGPYPGDFGPPNNGPFGPGMNGPGPYDPDDFGPPNNGPFGPGMNGPGPYDPDDFGPLYNVPFGPGMNGPMPFGPGPDMFGPNGPGQLYVVIIVVFE